MKSLTGGNRNTLKQHFRALIEHGRLGQQGAWYELRLRETHAQCSPGKAFFATEAAALTMRSVSLDALPIRLGGPRSGLSKSPDVGNHETIVQGQQLRFVQPRELFEYFLSVGLQMDFNLPPILG